MPEFVLLAVVMLLGLAAYYSMVTYPKQRDFQKRQRLVSQLNVGDEVITFGGLIGKIMEVDADKGVAFVEIANGVIVRFLMASLMQVYDPEEIAQTANRR